MTDMELSEILNYVLGGGLVGAIIPILSISSALRKARADADKALAEADTVKITNTEQATRILVENIVKPLTEELNETRKEIAANRRETARLRKAIDGANSCKYPDDPADCPVLQRMRYSTDEREVRNVGRNLAEGQCVPTCAGQRKRSADDKKVADECTEDAGDADNSDGQPS